MHEKEYAQAMTDRYEIAPAGTVEAAKDMARALETVLARWEHSDGYYRYLHTHELPVYILGIKAALAKYERTMEV